MANGSFVEASHKLLCRNLRSPFTKNITNDVMNESNSKTIIEGEFDNKYAWPNNISKSNIDLPTSFRQREDPYANHNEKSKALSTHTNFVPETTNSNNSNILMNPIQSVMTRNSHVPNVSNSFVEIVQTDHSTPIPATQFSTSKISTATDARFSNAVRLATPSNAIYAKMQSSQLISKIESKPKQSEDSCVDNIQVSYLKPIGTNVTFTNNGSFSNTNSNADSNANSNVNSKVNSNITATENSNSKDSPISNCGNEENQPNKHPNGTLDKYGKYSEEYRIPNLENLRDLSEKMDKMENDEGVYFDRFRKPSASIRYSSPSSFRKEMYIPTPTHLLPSAGGDFTHMYYRTPVNYQNYNTLPSFKDQQAMRPQSNSQLEYERLRNHPRVEESEKSVNIHAPFQSNFNRNSTVAPSTFPKLGAITEQTLPNPFIVPRSFGRPETISLHQVQHQSTPLPMRSYASNNANFSLMQSHYSLSEYPNFSLQPQQHSSFDSIPSTAMSQMKRKRNSEEEYILSHDSNWIVNEGGLHMELSSTTIQPSESSHPSSHNEFARDTSWSSSEGRIDLDNNDSDEETPVFHETGEDKQYVDSLLKRPWRKMRPYQKVTRMEKSRKKFTKSQPTTLCNQARDKFKDPHQLSTDDIKRYLYCDQELAARLLNVSLSTLKRRFYQMDMGRWRAQHLPAHVRKQKIWFMINTYDEDDKNLLPETIETLEKVFSSQKERSNMHTVHNMQTQEIKHVS